MCSGTAASGLGWMLCMIAGVAIEVVPRNTARVRLEGAPPDLFFAARAIGDAAVTQSLGPVLRVR
jgi:hypothetical protein